MDNFEIVDYMPQYRKVFGDLNRAWLEKYFWVEPLDEKVLNDPETYILAPGGAILIALANGLPVGVVALKKHNDLKILQHPWHAKENPVASEPCWWHTVWLEQQQFEPLHPCQ